MTDNHKLKRSIFSYIAQCNEYFSMFLLEASPPTYHVIHTHFPDSRVHFLVPIDLVRYKGQGQGLNRRSKHTNTEIIITVTLPKRFNESATKTRSRVKQRDTEITVYWEISAPILL